MCIRDSINAEYMGQSIEEMGGQQSNQMPQNNNAIYNQQLSQQQQLQQNQQNNNQQNSQGNGNEMARTVFKWTLGGNKVFIAGSFNGWKQVEMEQQGDEFSIVLNIPKGAYAYKFIVDGVWRFIPNEPTVTEPGGIVNNFIDLINQNQTYKKFDVNQFPFSIQQSMTISQVSTINSQANYGQNSSITYNSQVIQKIDEQVPQQKQLKNKEMSGIEYDDKQLSQQQQQQQQQDCDIKRKSNQRRRHPFSLSPSLEEQKSSQ
eukprot:TRINITY_DN289_c0_g1_i4.p1 TRINITY_DN289_c0_g1~~TRINITY_DN289_c0_g1_i4.p1  ORF type:complete len:260 (-),score=65.87 TRINITY_DN289_c0_g1_i4:329-1108(-)